MFLIVLITGIILQDGLFTIINAQTCQGGDLYSGASQTSSAINKWYLNTELSCTCSGQVTQYKVDYPQLTGPNGNDFNIHFALWDPVAGYGNTYELNKDSITPLTVTKNGGTNGPTTTSPSTPLYTRKGAIISVYFDGLQTNLLAYGQLIGNNLCNVTSNNVSDAAIVDCSSSENIISDRVILAEAVINLIDCSQAPNVANAVSTLVDGDTEYGARVRYTCVEGYEMTTGDEYLTCNESALWSGTVPECTIISCPVISNINNGSVNGDSNHYQSTKSFTCDLGFQLNGTSSVTCQIDGNWNDTIPQCDIVNCGDPGAPPINGTIQSGGQSFVYESVIVYQCSEEFYPSSWPVIQCTANGQWNSTVPTCVVVSSLSVSSSTASSTNSIMLGTSTSDSNVVASSTTTSSIMVTPTTSSIMSSTNSAMATSTTTNSVMVNPTTSSVMMTTTTTSSVMVTTTISTTDNVMETSTTTSTDSVMVTPTTSSVLVNPTTSSVFMTSTTSTTDNAMVTSTTSSSVIVNPTTLSTNNVMVTPSTSSTDSAMTTATTSTTSVMTSFNTSSIVIIASTSTATSSSMSEVTFSSTAAKDVVPTTDSSTSSPSQSLTVTMTISETSKDINKQSTSSITDATLSTVIIGGNQGDGNSGSLGIAVGVLAVALVGTIIFILVMIMLILVIRRRKKRAKYNIRRNGDFTSSTSGLINQTYSDMQVTDIKLSNPLYGAGQIEGQIDIYEHITEFDETNSDYCDVEEKAKLERALPPPTSFESVTESKPEIHSMSNGLYMYGRNDSIIKKPVTDDQYFELEESTDPAFIQEPIYWHPESSPLKLYDQLARRKYREISRDKLNITDHLGSGQFGSVEKGLWNSPRGTLEVAIKTLKGVASEEDEIKFLQEAAINGQFHHPNVVQLFGVVTVGQPTLIVLEYIPNGDLKEFLERRRPMPGELSDDSLVYMLIKFSHQVASGMVYLSKKRFIHRDLAARNILVGNDHICKIADFGMSRDLQDESYYRSNSKRIPVRWTAPEAIHYRKYSTQSDVWSFGAILYEIWSVGYKPFEQYTNQECLDLVDDGYRLVAPPGCGRSVYKSMIMCWNPNAADRPTFEYLKNELSKTEEIFAEAVPLKSNLGGSIHDDKSLYPDLQCRYMNEEDQLDEDNL